MNYRIRTVSLPSVVLFFIAILFFSSASFVSAQTTSTTPKVVTTPVLAGSVSCETPAIISLGTAVYDGSLHGFDFVVSDAFSVALSTSVGGKEIPFHFITREGVVEGGVKMHVNTQTTWVGASLPISVTMLSAKGTGEPVCLSTLSFELSEHVSAPKVTDSSAVAPIVSVGYDKKKIRSAVDGVMSAIKKVKVGDWVVEKGAVAAGVADVKKDLKVVVGMEEKKAESGASGVGASILGKTGVVASVKASLDKVCASERGSLGVWAVLLVLYAVGAFLLATRREHLFDDPMFTNAVLIAPCLALAAFWYFVPGCSVGWWTLALAVVIAADSVFGKFYWKKFVGKKGNPWTAFHP
ncbi:MAG TPA: hypothetical protein VJH33_02065 [Candidatus Paceibacterota bacterium]